MAGDSGAVWLFRARVKAKASLRPRDNFARRVREAEGYRGR